MPQFLVVFTPSRPEMISEGPTPEESAAVGRHFRYWQDLVGKGQALLAGRTQDPDEIPMGIAIFRAESREDAEQIAGSDPAVEAGVFHNKVRSYSVAILGDPAPFAPGQ